MELIGMLVAGAVIGSFLNVVIHRLPRQESIIWPPSHCGACNRRIRPWENIPIISYILLRGKCAHCQEQIPLRYLLVEILTPAILAGLFLLYGWSWEFGKNSVLALLLIPSAFIDLDHKLILNKITIPGMVVGLLLSLIVDPAHWFQPLLGLAAGGGFLWLVALVGKAIYRQESMGGGDIKFGAMIGAFMDWQGILLGLFLAFFTAALFVVVGLLSGRLRRHSTIPFGPFIALGALLAINFQDGIIHLYLHWIGF